MSKCELAFLSLKASFVTIPVLVHWDPESSIVLETDVSDLALATILVMNWLDPIEELYNMYSEEEDTPRIVEIEDDGLDFVSDIEGPADPYMDL